MYLLKQDLFISGLYSGSPTAPPTPSPPPGKGKGEGDLKGGTAPPTPNPNPPGNGKGEGDLKGGTAPPTPSPPPGNGKVQSTLDLIFYRKVRKSYCLTGKLVSLLGVDQ
jgi:hypothetical protein